MVLSNVLNTHLFSCCSKFLHQSYKFVAQRHLFSTVNMRLDVSCQTFFLNLQIVSQSLSV